MLHCTKVWLKNNQKFCIAVHPLFSCRVTTDCQEMFHPPGSSHHSHKNDTKFLTEQSISENRSIRFNTEFSLCDLSCTVITLWQQDQVVCIHQFPKQVFLQLFKINLHPSVIIVIINLPLSYYQLAKITHNNHFISTLHV